VREWGLPVGRGGRIEVNSDLRTTNDDHIFAIGDASIIVDNPLPQLAQPALQMGKHAAKNLVNLYKGLPTEAFTYHNKGTMATIGRADAVLQMPVGLKMTGLFAWLGWIALHILYLLGNRNRVSTLFNLAVRYMGLGRAGVIVGDVEPTAKVRALRGA
jgi:NADH dehydrogenase